MRAERRAFVAALVGAGAGAHGASDPVYATRVGAERPAFTNQPLGAQSKLMLAPYTGETAALPAPDRGDAEEVETVDERPAAPRRSASAAETGFLGQARERIEVLIEVAARRAGLDRHLVRAVVMVESRFRPDARSRADARGLMQVIPATGARYGVRDLFDPAENLSAGTRYLADLLRLFDGNVELALAGYNAGEGAVLSHGRRIPPYPQTRAYVPAVMSMWRRYAASDAPATQAVSRVRR
jgi:soluble lytic murein transglycosylase-like protein